MFLRGVGAVCCGGWGNNSFDVVGVDAVGVDAVAAAFEYGRGKGLLLFGMSPSYTLRCLVGILEKEAGL